MADTHYCYNCMTRHNLALSPCPKCGAKKNYQQKEPQDLPPGTLLNQRYVVGRKLGGGGFGATYIAYDETGKRVCSIKEFFPHNLCSRADSSLQVQPAASESAAFEKYARAFENEAQRLSQLQFIGGVVNIFEAFGENGTAYFSMEYLEGLTLSEYVKKQGKGGLPLKNALRLLYDVLKILKSVHAQGLLHRDISADNIMVLQDDSLKLIDFGAARDMIKTGKTIYSKGVYTAPEQRYGDPQKACTDLYSVGVLLFFLLVGRVPQQRGRRVESLRRARRRLPSSVYSFYEKATAVNPNYRFQNAADMMQAIKQVDSELAVRRSDRTRSYQRLIVILVTLFILSLAGIVIALWRK